MNTNLLMTISAAFLAALGLLFSFLPSETLQVLHADHSPLGELIVQLMGALYFAFGLLNYTARGAIIGGIYNKPIALGNLAHFFIGAVTLIKYLLDTPGQPALFYVFATFYGIFALLFAYKNFSHPGSDS